MSYQKITLVGHLGKDPSMRYTPAGVAVTSFSMATDRKYKNSSGEQVKETCWFRVSVWGKQGEACHEYLSKGSLVVVDGQLSCDPATGGPRVWADKSGSARASYEINASHVSFESAGGPMATSEGDVQAHQEEF